MANEITQSVQIKASKGGASVSFDNRAFFDMTGINMIQGTQTIGTMPELIDFGGIAGSPRFVVIKNLDSSNFVNIAGNDTMSGLNIKILPNDCCVFHPQSADVYAQADGASCLIQILAIEQD